MAGFLRGRCYCDARAVHPELHVTPPVSRSCRLPAAALLATFVCVAAPHAQEPSLEQLLGVMQSWLRDTYPRLANIVVDEEYAQEPPFGSTRRLASELLLVRHPVTPEDWLVFRDVLRVDGRPVTDHQQRLTELFIAPTAETLALVNEINASSLRYQLRAPHFALTNPFVVVGLMDRSYAARLDFRLTKADRKDDSARLIEFSERSDTTRLFGAGLARGTVLMDPATGRILKTQLTIQYAGSTLTTFRQDEALQVPVPVEMETRWGPTAASIVKGKAKYTRVRQFGVATDETLHLPVAKDDRDPVRSKH